MSLTVDGSVRRGGFHLDAALTVAPGEVVAVLGPNGSGKSTLLRAVAGLLALDEGSITLDGDVLDEPAAGVFVPPEQRSVGFVFQDYLLFEHLSAVDNVAFGLRARGTTKAEALATAMDWLGRVGLRDNARHRPKQLSGGQRQRVALARALATSPRLLLLDEPLAALDAQTRPSVRRDLRRDLAGVVGMTILVTHDPIDAYALADRIAILDHGTIVQSGTLSDVTAHPRSRYVADLVGTNLVAGTVRRGALTTATGAEVVVADATDGPTLAIIRPQAVTISRRPPAESSARNTWTGVVSDIERTGDRIRLSLDGALPLTAEITASALDSLGLRPGDEAYATVKATDINCYAD